MVHTGTHAYIYRHIYAHITEHVRKMGHTHAHTIIWRLRREMEHTHTPAHMHTHRVLFPAARAFRVVTHRGRESSRKCQLQTPVGEGEERVRRPPLPSTVSIRASLTKGLLAPGGHRSEYRAHTHTWRHELLPRSLWAHPQLPDTAAEQPLVGETPESSTHCHSQTCGRDKAQAFGMEEVKT